MEQSTITFQVEGETSRDANLLVDDLMGILNRNVRNIQLNRLKEDPTTLDPGTVIVAVLGTKFALELAKTLHAWLMRNHTAKLKIGDLEITGVSNATVETVAMEVLRRSQSSE
ncbi:hypothetical protein [Paraburkholderia saeva]|uniref:hypothetical protein n=1 Tax=Paraburkholderia saeva TaxID=2777537 RepID=UPI001D6759C5|nr:hypothetical protein [Paraburkholderia saeva]CAG4898207.1 hypothetical protein R70241_02442 [Paraburkholderia saeva]